MKSEQKKRHRNEDPYLSVKDAAEWCNVSVHLIYDRISSGELVSQRVGRIIRVRQSSLEQWLNEQNSRFAG